MFGKRLGKPAGLAAGRLGFETLESRVVMSATSLTSDPLESSTAVIAAPASPAPTLSASAPVTSAAILSTEEWVHSLAFWQFNLLLPDQVPYLTAAQIATIPNSSYFGQISAAARGNFNVPQVQALNTGEIGIGLLTPQQASWLTAPQIQSLKYFDFHRLNAAQIPSLTPAQIATIPHSGYLSSWSADARAALTASQVQSLNISTISIDNLTNQQIGWLTTQQVQKTRFYEFSLLQPAQIPALTAAQIKSIPHSGYLAGWSAVARSYLTSSQVQLLDTAVFEIRYLNSTQISWLTTAQVQSVRFYEFNLLMPSQIPSLTSAQILAIPHGGYLTSWSAASRAALTASQVQLLDMDVFRANLLTPQQVSLFTTAQVQDLRFYELHLLQPSQIPALTAAQIKSIPHSGYLAGWSAAARAALTSSQVQLLDMAAFEIRFLNSTQISWLTAAQIQGVRFYEFNLLLPSQIPLLTSAQILAIPHGGYLSSWSAASRAALTVSQVQLLDMDDFRADLLTGQQVGWLTAVQVRKLRFYEFNLLQPAQIPLLTVAQIASIPHSGYVSGWSVAARAALTVSQVQALNIATFEIRYLTDAQVSWLSTAQVRNLRYNEFTRLLPSQIPLLTNVQLSTIPNGAFLYTLPGPLQAALTRDQILGLSIDVWNEYTRQVIDAPSNYHPAEHMVIGPDGLPTDPHMDAEASRLFALVPLQGATHTTIASGNWSDPSIWRNGAVPGANAKVVIAAGISVRFDAFMSTAIDTLRIDGTLSFAVDTNTQLKADTVVVYTTGKLYVGTEANPIRDAFTAKILIADRGPINTVWDPYLLSRGVISRGEVRMYGKTVTPYVSLAVDPRVGDTTLSLSQVPMNWKVGDKIVLTGTDAVVNGFQSEERIIRGISGSTVIVDALRFNHDAVDGYGASVHVANLSRNVVLEAEDPSVIAERPHMMFLQNPNVVLQNIGVYGFGRTDKSVAVTDPVVVNGVLQPGTGANPRARYAIHFHHTGVDPDYSAANVRGSVVVGSPGWGYVNHNSNVNFDNNVAYGAYGASFATENGNEIGRMWRNLSINAEGSREDFEVRMANHDFGIQGNGFWLQGPGVEVVQNISAGSRGVGFVIYDASKVVLFDAVNLENPDLAGGQEAVPVGSVPIKNFYGNVAYTAPVALQVWRHMFGMTDGEGVIDSFFSWNTKGGIDIRYSSHLRIRNATLVGNLTDFTGVGIGTITTHDVVFENVRIEGFDSGIIVPTRRSAEIIGGYFRVVRGLVIEKGHDDIRAVSIISPEFASLTTQQLSGRIQHDIYMSALKNFANVTTGQIEYFTEDRINYTTKVGNTVRLFYAEQQPGFVPFLSSAAQGYVPSQYLNLTNQQLMNTFGLAISNRLVAGGAPTNLKIRGFAESALID